jgi:hypothetical protein
VCLLGAELLVLIAGKVVSVMLLEFDPDFQLEYFQVLVVS